MILYAIKDHRARIEVGYGLEPILPDGKVGSFQREAIPLMRKRKLQRGPATGHQPGSGRDCARCRNPDPQCASLPPPMRAPAHADDQHISLGGIIVFVVILLIVLCTPLRGVLFWILLSQVSGGRSGGDWGGGGFGGGRRRLWRFWRRQFRWRRGKQQLVVSEDAMIPDKKLEEFVRRMREAAGANLESVILYGSAVAGDFHPEFSNLNLFCVLRDSSFADLQALAPVARWWEGQKQPPPLIMTRHELERSNDVFTIELLDMQQHHRVLFGEDVLLGLHIPVDLHRVQVEYELREKLILLRQQLLLSSGNNRRLWELLVRSVSSFVTLFRHALIVLGQAAPVGKREYCPGSGGAAKSRCVRYLSMCWTFGNTRQIPRVWMLTISSPAT